MGRSSARSMPAPRTRHGFTAMRPSSCAVANTACTSRYSCPVLVLLANSTCHRRTCSVVIDDRADEPNVGLIQRR